jgi:hypothetical protein
VNRRTPSRFIIDFPDERLIALGFGWFLGSLRHVVKGSYNPGQLLPREPMPFGFHGRIVFWQTSGVVKNERGPDRLG